MPSTAGNEFKYEQWAEQLRSKIQRGELTPGDRLPSHADMKEQFGLSRPTVERIHLLLEREGLIVREERRGAFVAARQNPVSNVIGVFSPLGDRYEHQPYNMHLLAGVREVAERLEHQILLLGGSTHREGRKFDWTQVGGVLTLASDDRHIAALIDSLPPGMPCVTLIGESPRALSVSVDDYHGSMAATEHLLELGHRRIAALISPISLITRRRIEGYRQALRKAGLRPREKWLRDQNYRLTAQVGFVQAAKQTMAQWLREDWSPLDCTAIVAQNDESAIGIIEALHEAGLRVPDDVSVIGFDGTELARHFRPRLTTMEVPLHEIGARGAQWLIEQMEASRNGTWTFEAAARETIVLLPRLRVGESTAKVSLAQK
jgi:DNA-binding LacI/PurR family transcriptional regulator